MKARKRPEIGEYVWVRKHSDIYAGRVIQYSKYDNIHFFLQIDKVGGRPIGITSHTIVVSCSDIISAEIEKELLRNTVNDLMRRTDCYQR